MSEGYDSCLLFEVSLPCPRDTTVKANSFLISLSRKAKKNLIKAHKCICIYIKEHQHISRLIIASKGIFHWYVIVVLYITVLEHISVHFALLDCRTARSYIHYTKRCNENSIMHKAYRRFSGIRLAGSERFSRYLYQIKTKNENILIASTSESNRLTAGGSKHI